MLQGKQKIPFNQHNLEIVFGGVLRHIKLLGENLHNDEDKTRGTVLTDDEKAVVFYGENQSKIHLRQQQRDCHFED